MVDADGTGRYSKLMTVMPWCGALALTLSGTFVLMGGVAQAGTGDPMLLGRTNIADNITQVTTSSGDGFVSQTNDPGASRTGLFGLNSGGGDGVYGSSYERNGVDGVSGSSVASGVYGENDAGGFGLAGRERNNGVAVFADAGDGTGTALRTTGKLQFQNRSGIVTVPSGKKLITVPRSGVTTASMVNATVQQTGGFFVQAAVPANGSLTIYLNKAPTAPGTVKVAYLVLN